METTPSVGPADPVRELLLSRSPRARSGVALADDLLLGAGGLGLDSIATVELLLDCERQLGLATTAELLAGPPLTVGRLAAHVRASAGR
jgi:acyl carrier protein